MATTVTNDQLLTVLLVLGIICAVVWLIGHIRPR